jgi:hypothetical protein
MISDRASAPEERAAYRRWVRDHHPDVGGDPEEFAAGLARLRAATSGAGSGCPERRRRDRYDAPVAIVPDHQRLRAAARRLWRRLHRPDPPRVR